MHRREEQYIIGELASVEISKEEWLYIAKRGAYKKLELFSKQGVLKPKRK